MTPNRAAAADRRTTASPAAKCSAMVTVEAAQALYVPELLALARQQGGGPPDPGAVVVHLETRPASTLLSSSRVVFVLCPGCGSRRRALFLIGGRLACRRCHRLPYQSQTHGHWTAPLVETMEARRRMLAGRPGPKGRRYRAWVRRLERIKSQAEAWIVRWEQRWSWRLRRERNTSRRLRRLSRHMGGRF